MGDASVPVTKESSHAHFQSTKENCVPCLSKTPGAVPKCRLSSILLPSVTHATVLPHPKSPQTPAGTRHLPKASLQNHNTKKSFSFVNYRINISSHPSPHTPSPPPPHAAGNTRVYVFGKRKEGNEREREKTALASSPQADGAKSVMNPLHLGRLICQRVCRVDGRLLRKASGCSLEGCWQHL